MEQTKYDVFISYSRADYVDERGMELENSEVANILQTLKQAKISFWFDKKVKHGEDFGETILKYIKASKIFVYLSTEEANRSEWTRNEIACALMYQKKIIPVRIDESTFHDSVMFRIAALDHINYYLNPKKGREELIDSIKRYLEEEEAAAARREEEERRRREEQDLQRRQQESLRLKQQQAENLRAEISKTEEECSVLEKDLLRKKHDVEVVNAELNSKLNHLDEQKQKMSAILHDEDGGTMAVDGLSSVAPVMQPEDMGFQFHWLHPLKSLREMWQKVKETAAKRHWMVNLTLWLYFVANVFLSFVYITKIYSEEATFFAPAVLISYALFQLLLGKRSGIVLLLFTPVLIILVDYFYGNDLYRSLINNCEEMPSMWPSRLIFIILYLLAFYVLLILKVRKGGISAWSLLEGKDVHALYINKNVCFYFTFFVLLLISICYFERQKKMCINYVNVKTYQAGKITKERDSLIAERDTLFTALKDGYGYTLYGLAEKYYTKKRYKEATMYYKIAEKDSTSCDSYYTRFRRMSQFRLGEIYELGLGGELPNKMKALEYYNNARNYYHQSHFKDAFGYHHHNFEYGKINDAEEAYQRLYKQINPID